MKNKYEVCPSEWKPPILIKFLYTKAQTNHLGFNIYFTISSVWSTQVACPFKTGCLHALVSMWALRLYLVSEHNRSTFSPNYATTSSECILSSRIAKIKFCTYMALPNQNCCKCFTNTDASEGSINHIYSMTTTYIDCKWNLLVVSWREHCFQSCFRAEVREIQEIYCRTGNWTLIIQFICKIFNYWTSLLFTIK